MKNQNTNYPNYVKETPKFTTYIGQLNIIIFCAIAIGVVAFILSAFYFFGKIDIAGAVLTLLGYIPVIALLQTNLKKQWENSLPAYLDAHFEFQGKKLVVMSSIPLFNETDLRAQAQSAINILLPSESKNKFPLKPIISEGATSDIVIDKNKLINSGNPLKKHCISISLTRNPFITDSENQAVKFEEKIQEHISSIINDNCYLYIYYPFDLESNILVKKRLL